MAKLLKRVLRKAFGLAGRHGLLNWMPDETFIRIRWRLSHGGKLNLDAPQTFNEKLQWLKLHDRRAEYVPMVDKYEAKKYVQERLGEKYIIPTLGVWERFGDIDFDALPEKFVLKCTHDSGGLVICRDKAQLDMAEARRKVGRSLKRNFFYVGREWPYKQVHPRIIAEEYLENDASDGLHDYKVWCFGGEPVYVQYISGRLSRVTQEAFYDENWVKQDFSFHNPLMEQEAPRPACLPELLDCCRKLAQGMPFVRIDFYILPDESLRFGEITFYPMTGFETFKPASADKRLGDMINLK